MRAEAKGPGLSKSPLRVAKSFWDCDDGESGAGAELSSPPPVFARVSS